MLREIHCDQFRVSPIRFHPGLNVVLGDEKATNSIGKSTLLMIVDFALGGRHLLDHNEDLVPELGHHDYHFVFEFGETTVRYRRGTFEPEMVYLCDEDFEPQEALTLRQYCAFLKQAYQVDLPHITWRDLVSLFLRIWGKDNLSVPKPLHVVQNEPARKAIDRLTKVFGRYAVIEELSARMAEQEGKLDAVKMAVRRNVVPRIRAPEYTKNVLAISEVQGELESIRHELAKYAANIGDLVSREVLDLKSERDKLTAIRTDTASRLKRTQANIAENRHIAGRHFHRLIELVPGINEERLAAIEEFHNGVARALRAELREAEKELTAQLGTIDDAVNDIDRRMADSIRSVDEPAHLVDRVVGLATELQRARRENAQYEEEEALRSALGATKEELSARRRRILAEIEGQLNAGMRDLVSAALSPERKSPVLELSETNYRFDIFDDTGTGTAYLGVVVFDLTMFSLTQLPVVAHDTLMFKHVENDAVARFVRVYTRSAKQSFIAIDEITKYGTEAAHLLQQHSVVRLSQDQVLYIKDWRPDHHPKEEEG